MPSRSSNEFVEPNMHSRSQDRLEIPSGSSSVASNSSINLPGVVNNQHSVTNTTTQNKTKQNKIKQNKTKNTCFCSVS